MFELHVALLNPRSWDLDRHVYDLLHSSFGNPLLRNHLDHFKGLLLSICGIGISTISDIAPRLWDLRGCLCFLIHWHMSLILCCLEGTYLALDQLSV